MSTPALECFTLGWRETCFHWCLYCIYYRYFTIRASNVVVTMKRLFIFDLMLIELLITRLLTKTMNYSHIFIQVYMCKTLEELWWKTTDFDQLSNQWGYRCSLYNAPKSRKSCPWFPMGPDANYPTMFSMHLVKEESANHLKSDSLDCD